MPVPISCCNPCDPQTISLIPGVQGETGASGSDGTDGSNAYTVTTGTVILPASAGPVVLATTFADATWMSVGQVIIISDGANWGNFRVLTLPAGGLSATLEWLDYAEDAAGTTVLASGATVSASGEQPALAAALPTALTDNSTGTSSDTIAAGVGVQTLCFYIEAASIADGDLLTTYVPGYRFKILKFDARCAKVVSTGAKASTLNLEIGTTNLTGGVISLAGTYAIGAAQAGTAVTANNVGTATDSFSIEASSTTTFIEGAFWLIVSIQNMDSADAVASLADHVNDLITSLT